MCKFLTSYSILCSILGICDIPLLIAPLYVTLQDFMFPFIVLAYLKYYNFTFVMETIPISI